MIDFFMNRNFKIYFVQFIIGVGINDSINTITHFYPSYFSIKVISPTFLAPVISVQSHHVHNLRHLFY